MRDKPRPLQIMQDALRLHPQAVELAGRYRKPGGPSWPSWCYLPMPIVSEILTPGATVAQRAAAWMHPLKTVELSLLTASLAWRQTKTIYRFDPDLSSELINQPLDGDIPTDVLMRMPEWCLWVEAPGLTMGGVESVGFFAWLEWDLQKKRAELRFMQVFGGSSLLDYSPVILFLDGGTLEESVRRLQESAAKKFTETNLPKEFESLLGESMPKHYMDGLAGMLNLVLYLCSAEPDIADYRPAVKRPGNSAGPSTPRTWDVGVRIGATIRTHRNEVAIGEQLATEPSAPGTHASPRPHIRRAHWHRYRIGEGRAGITIKWIAPMLVGGKGPDDAVATIRRVK